jgi:hypothetical protein
MRRDCPARQKVGGFFRSGFKDLKSYNVEVRPELPCVHYAWDTAPLGQIRGSQRKAVAALMGKDMPLHVLKTMSSNIHIEDIRTGSRRGMGVGQGTLILRKVRVLNYSCHC